MFMQMQCSQKERKGMDKQAQVEEFAKALYDIHCDETKSMFPIEKWKRTWENCSDKEYFLTMAQGLIDEGYTRTNPLVALDREEVAKTLKHMPCVCHTSYEGDRSIIADFICYKFGSPTAKIPSEDELAIIARDARGGHAGFYPASWDYDMAKSIHNLITKSCEGK